MKTLKELNKYTLARYQAKAADDLRFRGVDQGAKIGHAISKGGDMRKTDPDIEKRSRKLDKRVAGIGRAANKLTQKTNEDIEQIDELSPKTLGDYATKAAGDLARRSYKMGAKSMNEPESEYKKGFRKVSNRQTGLARAADKLVDKGRKMKGGVPESVEYIDEEEAYAKIHSFHAHPDGKFTIGIKHKAGRFADEKKVMHTGTMQHLQKVTKRYPLTGSVSVHSVKTGRENIKEGHSKKKYLRNLKMTMNQATLGDMSTALQKGGFQGKGQYEEVEQIDEGIFGSSKAGRMKSPDYEYNQKHDKMKRNINYYTEPVQKHVEKAEKSKSLHHLKRAEKTMNQITSAKKAAREFGEETEILEDGHTDVASAMRKCKTIMEDAGDIQTKLAMMGSVDSLPSWWTNKLAVAAAYMDSMRDYLLYPTNEGHVKQDMIKKGYARGNRDVDPRMMIPKTKPKDKQMKLPLKEKHMTDGQMEKREKIVMAMKPKMKGFKDRYGDDAKNVMYATATKMAMKKEDTNLFEKVKKRKSNQKKLAGNDKFEADPTLTSQIMRPDNPSNDNDNKI